MLLSANDYAAAEAKKLFSLLLACYVIESSYCSFPFVEFKVFDQREIVRSLVFEDRVIFVGLDAAFFLQNA